VAYRQQPAPEYSGPVMVDHGVPPIEYVEGGAPVYYETEPGVAFYPIYLDAPGSCFCIVPMRYVGGAWLGVGGVVLYRGHFPYHHALPQHREVWLRSGGEFGGHRPVFGRIERNGNVLRPLPPPGSIHIHESSRQVQGAQPIPQTQAIRRESPIQQQQAAPNTQFRQQQVQQPGQQRPTDASGGQPAGNRQPGGQQQPPQNTQQPVAASQPKQQQAPFNAPRERDRKSEGKCSKEAHEAKKC